MAQKGETYTFVADESIGSGNGSLAPGTTVTVREVIEAGEPGAPADEGAAVITWMVPSITKTEKGNEIGEAERAFAIPLTELTTHFNKES